MESEAVFTSDGHLNEQGIAYCAEFIKDKATDELPPLIQKHLESCILCKQHVMATIDALNDLGFID